MTFDRGTVNRQIARMTIDTAAVAVIYARNGIERLRIFGSFARGGERADIDVDMIADGASQ